MGNYQFTKKDSKRGKGGGDKKNIQKTNKSLSVNNYCNKNKFLQSKDTDELDG